MTSLHASIPESRTPANWHKPHQACELNSRGEILHLSRDLLIVQQLANGSKHGPSIAERRLTDPNEFDMLPIDLASGEPDAIRPTKKAGVHHAARRRGGVAACGAGAAASDAGGGVPQRGVCRRIQR